MSVADYKDRTTVTSLRTISSLVEDVCSEASCGMTILVDAADKEKGYRSQCTACLMRNKIARGEIK